MKKHKQIKKVRSNVTVSPVTNEYYSFIIAALFFLIAFIGILNHEMWRDEFQAWLIAKEAHSIIDLYNNCIYEGHPILWHLLLFITNFFSDNVFSMQLLHILIATVSVFLFNRYAGLSLFQKILFSFGFYSLYEYSIIARSYSLDLMLVLLFCTLYQSKVKNIVWIFFVLSLLANNSVYGLATACCLTSFLFLDYTINKTNAGNETFSRYKLAIGLSMFLLAACFSVIQIIPEADHERRISFLQLFNFDTIKLIFSRIYNAYIVIPEMKIFPLWNTGYYISSSTKEYFFLSLLIFVAAIFIFLRKPILCYLYIAGTLGVVCLNGLTACYAPRYIGHIFIFFLATIFLSSQFPDQNFENKIVSGCAQMGKRIQNAFIFIVFGCQMVMGIAYYYNDLKNPFSMSKKAAQYIYSANMESLPIIGTRDYVVSNLAALLDKKIFYPERNEFGSFIIWDGKRDLFRPFEAITRNVDSLLATTDSRLLLILSFPLTYVNGNSQVLFTSGMLTSTINLEFLNKFEGGMVKDESYYIYIAHRKVSQ